MVTRYINPIGMANMVGFHVPERIKCYDKQMDVNGFFRKVIRKN